MLGYLFCVFLAFQPVFLPPLLEEWGQSGRRVRAGGGGGGGGHFSSTLMVNSM